MTANYTIKLISNGVHVSRTAQTIEEANEIVHATKHFAKAIHANISEIKIIKQEENQHGNSLLDKTN